MYIASLDLFLWAPDSYILLLIWNVHLDVLEASQSWYGPNRVLYLLPRWTFLLFPTTVLLTTSSPTTLALNLPSLFLPGGRAVFVLVHFSASTALRSDLVMAGSLLILGCGFSCLFLIFFLLSLNLKSIGDWPKSSFGSFCNSMENPERTFWPARYFVYLFPCFFSVPSHLTVSSLRAGTMYIFVSAAF